MNPPTWTIGEVPGAEWLVDSVRHLSGAENQGRHHVFVDATGRNEEDLRGTGLHVAYGWDGMSEDEVPPLAPIDKPADEFGCHIPIFQGAVMHVAMHGAPSQVVRGLHTAFNSDDEGNSWGYQSFHIVFRYRPAQAEPEPQPQPQAMGLQAPDSQPDAGLHWKFHARSDREQPHHTARVNDQIVAWVIETDSNAGHALAYLATDPEKVRLTPIQVLNGVGEAKAWAEKKAMP
jgi:hypothetical protein